MMKTLRVTLADLEGIPHATAAAATAVTVTAAYTGPVILTDGTIIPTAIKAKTVGSSGVVNFSVHASDDPAVRSDHQGFAITVTAQIRLANGTVTAFKRTVKPLESMSSTIQLGTLTEAQGLPPQWTTIEELVAALEEGEFIVGPEGPQGPEGPEGPQGPEGPEGPAGADGGSDEGFAALIDNPATDTRAALDGTYPRGVVDLSSMAGIGSATWDRNLTLVGHPDLTLVDGPAANSVIVGGGHKGDDFTSPNEIVSTNPYYRLMTIVGGYDSTITDALASSMFSPMHGHIHAGSSHAGIVGGSYQNVYNCDYGGAIFGTLNTVGLDGVAQSGWHVLSVGGKDNSVSGHPGTTGVYATNVGGLNNTIRSTTTGDPDVNGGRYSFQGGGILNVLQGNASGQVGGQSNKVGDDVTDAGSLGSHSGQVGGYLNKVTTGQYVGQVGGHTLTASGHRSGQVGGTNNTVAGLGTATVGGQLTTVTGLYSGTVGGANHDVTASAHYAGIVGGSHHTLTHRFTGALGGRDSTISGENGATLGGRYNVVGAINSTAAGVSSRTRLDGAQAYAYGAFDDAGDAQSFIVQLRREYAGGGAAPILMNDGIGGSDQHLIMPNNSAWRFSAEVVGRCASSGEVIGGTITGTIKRGANAASTALVGTPVVVDQKDNPAWNITAVANTTQGSLQIQGQHGDGAKTLRWTARLTVTEIVY